MRALWSIGVMVFVAAGLCPAPARAVFNISSTDVKEGLLVAELRNRWDFDDDNPSQDGYRNHVFKLEYGLTDYVALEWQGKAEKRQRNAYEISADEIETKIRFYKPGEYWLDSAIKFSYEWSHVSRVANKAKAKLLLQKDSSKWNSLLNLNVSKDVGTDATRDTGFDTAWRVKYKWNKHVEPGFELYDNWGEVSRTGDFDDQKHRIGPMAYGEIVPGVKYQLGYLFGLSDAAEDGSLKFFLKYEIPL